MSSPLLPGTLQAAWTAHLPAVPVTIPHFWDKAAKAAGPAYARHDIDQCASSLLATYVEMHDRNYNDGLKSEINSGTFLAALGLKRTLWAWVPTTNRQYSKFNAKFGPRVLGGDRALSRLSASRWNTTVVGVRPVGNDYDAAEVTLPSELLLEVRAFIAAQHEGRSNKVLLICGESGGGKTRCAVSANTTEAVVIYATPDEYGPQNDPSIDHAITYVEGIVRSNLSCFGIKSMLPLPPFTEEPERRVTIVLDEVGSRPLFCQAVCKAATTIRDRVTTMLGVGQVAIALVGTGVEATAKLLGPEDYVICSPDSRSIWPEVKRQILENKSHEVKTKFHSFVEALEDKSDPWCVMASAILTNSRACGVFTKELAGSMANEVWDITAQMWKKWLPSACKAVATKVRNLNALNTFRTHQDIGLLMAEAFGISLFGDADFDSLSLIEQFGMLVDRSVPATNAVGAARNPKRRYHMPAAQAAMAKLEYGLLPYDPPMQFRELVSWWLQLGLKAVTMYGAEIAEIGVPHDRRLLQSMRELLQFVIARFPHAVNCTHQCDAALVPGPDGVAAYQAVITRMDEGVSIPRRGYYGDSPLVLGREDAMMTIHNSTPHSRIADAVMVFNGGILVRKDMEKRSVPLTVVETYAAFYEMGAVNVATQAAVVLREGLGASALLEAACVASTASTDAAWRTIVTSSDPTVAAALSKQFKIVSCPGTFVDALVAATKVSRHVGTPAVMFVLVCLGEVGASEEDLRFLPPHCRVVHLDHQDTEALYPAMIPQPPTLEQGCIMDHVPADRLSMSILSASTVASRKRARGEEGSAVKAEQISPAKRKGKK